LTFDDGFADFALVAAPILREFGYPATLYLYSYYVGIPYPVWPPIGRYLLWKGDGQTVSGEGLVRDGAVIRTATQADRDDAMRRMHEPLLQAPAAEREAVATTLAERLGVDYAAIKARRILQLMRPEEIAVLDRTLVDVQLHTHRHMQPSVRDGYDKEITDNRAAIEALVGTSPPRRHFCYPSGIVRPEVPEWLRAHGIVSATTCVSGLATRRSDRWRLPRFVDTTDVTASEFEAWLSGVAAMLPRRA
jgi:peptidoglycan/xylan/chitin deacetylase (PgdA/CDA1 family)